MDTRSDRDAERSVLAACLLSTLARTEARRHLIGADFEDPRHEILWDAMSRLDRHGKAVDPQTLLTLVRGERGCPELLLDLATLPALPEHVGDYAAVVRGWSIKRHIHTEAIKVQAEALNPSLNAHGYAASVATRFAGIRDSGITEDISSKTLAEILSDPDDEPDWLIPGLLERRDRLMLTGAEGLGKSHLLRQFAVSAAAGIDPWGPGRTYEPVKVAIFDCENTERQVRRATRAIVDFTQRYGRADVADRVLIRCSSRIDITRDRDLATIHRELDASQPDLVVIGPLYRLTSRALQTDDEAGPVLAALDTIRDRGIALLIEAHAGHAIGKGGERDMRPRGSSALLGWPEFGYGLRDIGAKGYCDFVAWRGNRSERDWPSRLRRSSGEDTRWIPHDDTTDYSGWGA